ncbi:folate-binding protein, partial [Eikenella corrodens]|nr:folate-binding protein [Eikenella corrodens]
MHTLCKLPFFGVAEASGADAAEFLHSQLSNHILDLQSGEACFATYNSPRGRVLANMLVLRRADRFLLVMAADLLEATIKRLRMFVLRSKTVFHTDSAWQVYGQSGADTGADAAALKFAVEEGDNG